MTIAQQNIVEVENVLIHGYKFSHKQAIEDIITFIDTFSIAIIHPQTSTIIRYHQLLGKIVPKDIFGLFLAATYLDNDVHHLLTANTKDFTGIPEFKAISPSEMLKSIN